MNPRTGKIVGRFPGGAIAASAIAVGPVVTYDQNRYPRTDYCEIFANLIGIVPQADVRSATADVTRWEAAIDQARAAVANAEQGVSRAQAEWSYADNNLHRIEPLLYQRDAAAAPALSSDFAVLAGLADFACRTGDLLQSASRKSHP